MAITFNHNDQVYVKDGKMGIGTASPSEALHIYSNATSAEIRLQNNTISSYIRSNTDNLNFYVSNGEKMRITSAGNVGIGTTSPISELHVVGSARVVTNDSAGGDTLIGAISGVSNGYRILTNTSNEITYSWNTGDNVQAVTINNSGNVGIGTTSPSYKLDVVGSARLSDSLYVGGNKTSGATLIQFNNYDAALVDQDDIQNIIRMNGRYWSGSNNQIVKTEIRSIKDSSNGNGGSALGFATQTGGDAPVEHMRINKSGNVGIGTTSPGAVLTVGEQSSGTSGTGVAQDNSIVARFGAANQAGRVMGLTVANTATATVDNVSALSFIVAGNYSATGIISTVLRSTSTAGTDMVFSLYNNSMGEKMRITASGNVGIGTTSPAAKLEVGTSSYSANNAIANFVNGNNPIRVSYDTVVVAQQDVPCLSIVETIDGTQANEQKLTLSVGDARAVIGSSSTATEGIYINTNRATNAPGYNQTLGTNVARFLNNGNAIFPGNVGIGTTSPSQKLHIASSSAAHLVSKLEQDNSDYQAWYEANSQDGGYVRFGIGDNANNFAFWNTDQGTYKWYVSGVERMNLTNSGNLGIGTTSPSQKLDVNGDIALKGTSVFNLNSAALTIGDTAGTDSVTTLKLTTAGDSTTVYLDDDGNVGIGTTDPKAALDVKGRFLVDSKSMTITNSFNDALTVVMSDHTGCYVKITAFGDWSSHSSISYLGEFFLNNGAGGYNEPGLIIRQIDGTASDAIEAQIVDPGGTTGDREFIIQLRATATASFTAYLTYNIQGMFVSAS